MRHLTILLFILIFCCRTKETLNQSVDESDTILAERDESEEGENGCTYIKNSKRLQDTHPFDISDKVEIVTYKTRINAYSNDDLIRDGKFTVTEIQQRIELDKTQRDSLFSILYNYKKIKKGNVESAADCYDPHHSVIFYEDGSAIAFLEACFQCYGTRNTKGLDFGEFCDEKWCAIQKFFKASGADFGLINEMCE